MKRGWSSLATGVAEWSTARARARSRMYTGIRTFRQGHAGSEVAEAANSRLRKGNVSVVSEQGCGPRDAAERHRRDSDGRGCQPRQPDGRGGRGCQPRQPDAATAAAGKPHRQRPEAVAAV